MDPIEHARNNRNKAGSNCILSWVTGESMAWFVRDKEKDRFYLLPGMGGRALRRKRKIILQWSIAAGLLVSALLASALYLMSKR